MNPIPSYKIQANYSGKHIPSDQKLQYFFESKGVNTIVKVIEYSPFTDYEDKIVYNLAFGDYDEASDTLLDEVNSNNGDMHKVFSTVLSSVPQLFKIAPSAAIWVQGSDSATDFEKNCRPECKKRCGEVCKNLNRRIKAYQYFVNKNYTKLIEQYKFMGLTNETTPKLVEYSLGEEYQGIMVYPREKH